MNTFLKEMDITFRRDPTTMRPRVNKEASQMDMFQKGIGEYYYTKTTKPEQQKHSQKIMQIFLLLILNNYTCLWQKLPFPKQFLTFVNQGFQREVQLT